MENTSTLQLDRRRCAKARRARDARFDGLFFTGVKTTGIFCRPICPATPPKERNVEYFSSALYASQAGLRPCLRCRPESAPGSPAWRGVQTTLSRAIALIDAGEWQGGSLPAFAERLGVSDRYLRRLFRQHLGVSPVKYANYQRAMFAKQLLQQTALPITEVAYRAGFGSARRFNDVFMALTGLNPRQMRRAEQPERPAHQSLSVLLSYRPPYDWAALRDFYCTRQIGGMECVTADSYSRTFHLGACAGVFTATHLSAKNAFRVELELDNPAFTLPVIQRIRRVLDLDADVATIAADLGSHPLLGQLHRPGLRLPGIWSPFEAGVRAILGQQVSVKAAHKLVTRLVEELGAPAGIDTASGTEGDLPHILFPTPAAVMTSDLAFLAMPERRKQALRGLAEYVEGRACVDPGGTNKAANGETEFDHWLALPGIGPWTVQYTAFRMGNPDIFLAGDLGVKNALKKLAPNLAPNNEGALDTIVALDTIGAFDTINGDQVSPWGSYATLLLWQSLAGCGGAAGPNYEQTL